MALAVGCGCSMSPPPLADASTGRSVVDEALAAWKDSAPLQSLREKSNAIHVADPRWESGWKLDGYEIVDNAADGFQSRCKVKLALTDPKGKPAKEIAEYLATTSPKRTVTRVSEGW